MPRWSRSWRLRRGASPSRPRAASETLPEFGIANGYYYSEAAGGDPRHGYTITNEDGIPFWDAFQRLGGVDAIGYPATGRFTWRGFVDQATQKVILQWNPARGQVEVVNVFDVIEQMGLDGQLQAKYQTPPSADNGADAGKGWAQIVARHQAELDAAPAIKARYFADSDPIAHFGLPQAVADEGNVVVARCQRAVFQQWKVDEPWARAGQVTLANGGDVAKALGILPAGADATVDASSVIVGPFNAIIAMTPAQEQTARAVAGALRPSLVAIATDLGQGRYEGGSGMVLDANGDILTDAHVVRDAFSVRVLLPDGRVADAQVIGRDRLADVAVLRVPAGNLTPITRGSSTDLQPGAPLVSLGYSPIFPSPPALRVGQLVDVTPAYFSGAKVNRLVSNVADVFGDSGSPVVNTQGQVVGVVEQITFNPTNGAPEFSVDNALEGLLPIAQQIIATGKDVMRIILGFDGVFWTPDIAKQEGIPYVPGMYLFRVDPQSGAGKAGLAPGDVVTSVDGTAIATPEVLDAVLARHKAGDVVPIGFTSPDGHSHTAAITLEQG